MLCLAMPSRTPSLTAPLLSSARQGRRLQRTSRSASAAAREPPAADGPPPAISSRGLAASLAARGMACPACLQRGLGTWPPSMITSWSRNQCSAAATPQVRTSSAQRTSAWRPLARQMMAAKAKDSSRWIPTSAPSATLPCRWNQTGRRRSSSSGSSAAAMGGARRFSRTWCWSSARWSRRGAGCASAAADRTPGRSAPRSHSIVAMYQLRARS